MGRARCIAILTGGGDCPGLNAVIRGVTKTAMSDYGMRVLGIPDGFAGVIEDRMQELTNADVSGILAQGGTILGTSNKANPFAWPVRRKGRATTADLSRRVMRNLERHGVDCLVTVGGDGTQTIARDLTRKGLPVVGIPKTIDNDLAATDYTFGFDSAVAVATDACDRLHTTGMSHHRVMVLEVMGRYAGWIALYGGVAGGGDVILIPEIPYDPERVAEVCLRRNQKGKRFTLVVVAEGARPRGGRRVVKRMVKGSPDPVRLGGIGLQVAGEIEERGPELEARVTTLGHLARGGSPTAFDRLLATRFAAAATHLIARRGYGRMVALRGAEVVDVPLDEAVASLKTVPPEHGMLRDARSVGTAFGD